MGKLTVILILLTTFSCSQTEKIVSSGNSKLHYKTFGKGKPILIINGGPGMDSDGFDDLAKELAVKGFMTIIYDQRGTGKSTLQDINSETVTMDLMTQDIENLRLHLKIDKWIILGHSFGGILATHYATKHPEAIDKIIFSSSGGVNLKFMDYVSNRLNSNLSPIEKDSLAYYQTKRNLGDNSPETIKRRAHYQAKAYVYDKSKSTAIASRMTEANYTINSLVFQDLRKIRFNCTNSFHNFKQPVLILQGKDDIISTDTAIEIANSFPNSKLVLMNNCGHYGWLDAPEVYFTAIHRFLKNNN